MKKRILLIDDAAFLRMMCKDFLAKADFEIVGEAENGLEGVEKYKELNPDLVLLDIAMPAYDGMFALKTITEHDPNANIIMLSAIGHASSVIDCLKLGAKDFVVKPFQAETVVNKINSTLAATVKINTEKLQSLTPYIRKSGENILSPQEIDTIVKFTQSDEMTTEQVMTALMTINTSTLSAVAAATDEIPVLLHQMIQGQEKIISLLSKLTEK